ncbi:MAG: cofactor-independent phosphoglycerate mutase [Planctomycetes bacterium]|nr:cofactor-independent phosphoglycerate mutase [Planctomycetota bacterium]
MTQGKYVIIIPDGAADEPLEQFGGRTPLDAAETPNMDLICKLGRQGIVRTVPAGFEPGSDVAQMSLLGYPPERYYGGRAPLEAAARNIPLGPHDWVFRCNLVTLADGTMADHSAGHISTAEATSLIADLADLFEDQPGLEFHTGISYRHLLVFRDSDFDCQTSPPHDHIGQSAEKILPRGKGSDLLRELMFRSMEFLECHDINKVRRDLGENTVSSIWLWGQGRKVMLARFQDQFGLSGVAITAVDLVRGLAKLIGFDLIEVEGATGFFETNYAGKAAAALEALEAYDLVFVHIEAPDEASHQGNAEMKLKAIERIDSRVVGPILESLRERDTWRIMVLPDHATHIRTCAHSDDPVPFAMAGTGIKSITEQRYGEANARKSGFRIDRGHELMEYFLKSTSR